MAKIKARGFEAAAELSLVRARVDFINAISQYVPRVFEELHDLPLAAYRESQLPRLSPLRRVQFWERCYAGSNVSYSFTGFIHGQSGETLTYRSPGGGRQHLDRNEWEFLRDFGLEYSRQPHQDRYLNEIKPGIVAFLDALETWGQNNFLTDGWLLHWAFLKLDAYITHPPNSYFTQLSEELNPQLFDIFGKEVQPPQKEYVNFIKVDGWDFTLGRFEFLSEFYRPLLPNAEEEFIRRTRESFEIELKHYVTDARRYLELRPEIPTRRDGAQAQDYEWLARYQCNDKSRVAIAKSHFTDEDKIESMRVTITTTIAELAHYLGLTLREEKGGRRKGTKSLHYSDRESKRCN